MTIESSLPSSDIPVGDSAIKQDYERWDKAHGRMTNTPPSEGHYYIQHALNLLDFLKPISEIHPIAKAVVGCFEQLVLFEKDRRENDSRVESVILAQAGMMRVLLDIDDLTARPNNPSTLRAMIELPQLLSEVQKDISACHNSIDTYYREHRLVKLYRAKEWKEKMLEFVKIFDNHRVLLHQALSLQVASDVSDLVSKMDLLLGRLFTPREPWELDVTAKIRAVTLAKGASWIDDPRTIQSLAIATEDSSVNLRAHPSDVVENTKIGVQLSVLKEDLQLSLDILVNRNAELFELKLRMHTERLEKAIIHSARYVITSLSGPHDRLEHEDLRVLWKEMNWMFCVETKVFGIALFEYYLDRYSHWKHSDGSHDTSLWVPKFNPLYSYRSGSMKHPHAWTLLYLFLYADKISSAIDSDKSGLIRISEANAFTSQIPDGWTLPQWCAFLVEGQFHENSIYRKRLIHLMLKTLEIQPRVLPHNRYPCAEYMCSISARVLHYFILEPRNATKSHAPITPELHELVRKKMLEQDDKFRSRLRSINWTIPNSSTVEALSDGRPLETYLFPLLLVLLELMTDMHHLALSRSIDFKEWVVPYANFLSVRTTAANHFQHLKKHFDDDSTKSMASDLQTYHQGMWAIFQNALEAKDMSQFMLEGYEVRLAPLFQQGYDDFFADQTFLEEFPLPEFDGSLLSLKYGSWEDYKKDKNAADLPFEQPMTWSPIDDPINKRNLYNVYKDLPQSDWGCDQCNGEYNLERSFECMDCYDFDFCLRCYDLEPSRHQVSSHKFGHLMVARAMWLHPFRLEWMKFRTRAVYNHLKEKIKMITAPKTPSSDQEDSKSTSLIGVCARCSVQIVDWKARLYICGEYSCAKEALFICEECAWTNEFPEGGNHYWWHSLIPFDSRNYDAPESRDKVLETSSTQSRATVTDTETVDLSAVDDQTTAPQSSGFVSIDASSIPEGLDQSHGSSNVVVAMEDLKQRVSILDDKITQLSVANAQVHGGLEKRMDAMEAKLTGVESKIDILTAELRLVMDALLASRP